MRKIDKLQFKWGMPPTPKLDEIPYLIPPELAVIWVNVHGLFSQSNVKKADVLHLQNP